MHYNNNSVVSNKENFNHTSGIIDKFKQLKKDILLSPYKDESSE